MRECKIETYYVKADQPYTKWHDFFFLYPPEDFKHSGPNTWKGHYGGYVITIVQRNVYSNFNDDDITMEKQPDFKTEEGITYGIPSKKDLAQKLDEHLRENYD